MKPVDSLPIFGDNHFPVVPWGDGEATFIADGDFAATSPWAVVVFVVDGDRFLLGRVPRGWCTPSGHIERDEDPEDAARREVFEETGAHVDRITMIGKFVSTAHSAAPAVAFVYVAHVDDCGDIPHGSESTGARWFDISEVASVYWHWDALMERMFEYALFHAVRASGPAINET